MRLPDWLRRRRAFEGRRWSSDREACEAGSDPLESAINWMQHVLGRDYDGQPVSRAMVVVEVGESGPTSRTIYTTHDPDASSVEVRGLLSEGLRAHEASITRAIRHYDIEAFINTALPQIVEALDGSRTESAQMVLKAVGTIVAEDAEDAEQVRQDTADDLLRKNANCLKAAARSTDPAVRAVYLLAAEWFEDCFKRLAPDRWAEELDAHEAEREKAEGGMELEDEI